MPLKFNGDNIMKKFVLALMAVLALAVVPTQASEKKACKDCCKDKCAECCKDKKCSDCCK